MRCRKCIKKIGTGEDKIQNQDLVKLAKRISSKFDIALQMWAKKGGKEDTARPVAQRARIIRNHIGGKRMWNEVPAYPVRDIQGQDIPSGTVQNG